MEQSCPPTPGQSEKLAMHIPIAVGLLDAQGCDLPLTLDDAGAPDEVQVHTAPTTMVLELTEAKQSFSFTGIEQAPVPSLLRDFSAPVILDYDYSDEELAFLLAHDSDPFNRWEAGQRLATRRLLALAGSGITPGLTYHSTSLDQLIADALRKLVRDEALDPAFRDLVLTLPSEGMLAEQVDVIDPQAIHLARRALRRHLAHELRDDLLTIYHANQVTGAYSPDAAHAGRRALRNNALGYLAELVDDASHSLMQAHLDSASNMTDRIAALAAIVNNEAPGTDAALRQFYADFEGDALVIDKWFSLQAAAPTMTVARARELMRHPAFTLKNPNRARSLIFAFCNANLAQFHAPDGSGHAFWAEQVIALNAINPQVAARLARSMDRWRKFAPALQASMKSALQKVASSKKLSNDVSEVIGKALAN
jgi:aminopeptidase N